MKNLHAQMTALSMHRVCHLAVFWQLRLINERVGALEYGAFRIGGNTAGDDQANPFPRPLGIKCR